MAQLCWQWPLHEGVLMNPGPVNSPHLPQLLVPAPPQSLQVGGHGVEVVASSGLSVMHEYSNTRHSVRNGQWRQACAFLAQAGIASKVDGKAADSLVNGLQ